MKTNTTRSGKLLVPIVTVLYVILSAAGLVFFFLWHWLTVPFALYFYAQMYYLSLPILETDEVNPKFSMNNANAADEGRNAEIGVLRRKFNSMMEAVNNIKSATAILMILFPVMLLSVEFTFFCVDVNLDALSAGADSVFGLEFCNCVYDSILGNR